MEMIKTPLRMTLAQNRADLEASEKRMEREGSEYGNRHERRVAARHERRERKRKSVVTQDM